MQPTAVQEGQFVVEIAAVSFGNANQANKILTDLRQRGYQAFATFDPGRGMIHVYVKKGDSGFFR